MDRPDLTRVDPTVREYIEYLESQVAKSISAPRTRSVRVQEEEIEEPIRNELLLPEPPTTINLLTLSRTAIGKRTLRHEYLRQHRGGMGIFDLDVDEPDRPSALLGVNEGITVLMFTNLAKIFRVPLVRFPQTDIRSKGTYVLDKINLDDDERIVCMLPERASGYIAMVTASGRVRCLRHHLFGEHMRPGSLFFNVKDTGAMVAACWTTGDSELFVLTRRGMAIRFNEKLVNPQGDWCIKLSEGDEVVSVTSVFEDSNVFLLGSDGKGTRRTMSGFAANKSLGGSGKIAMKNEAMVAGLSVTSTDDIFAITRLGKIIRFQTDEIPLTDGVVQGVNCMALRSDSVVAVTSSGLNS
jgi:DNA gyrase subunit A